MGNEFVKTRPALTAGRGTEHARCQVCQQFRAFWRKHPRAAQWKRSQTPVDKLSARDPALRPDGDVTRDAKPVSEEGEQDTPYDAMVRQIEEATRVRILTLQEAAVLTAMWTIVHEGQRLSWRAVAARARCSRQRAQRTLFAALHRWHTACRLTDRLTEECQAVVIRIRGSRDRDVWLHQTNRLGTHQICRAERITDPNERQRILASRDRQADRVYRALPRTPVRILTAALALQLAGLSVPMDPETKRLTESPDWMRNRRWAERRLQRARSRTTVPIVRLADIYRVLWRGNRLCHACHTPILAGCKLDGHVLNRRREFCCQACKMHVQRKRSTETVRET